MENQTRITRLRAAQLTLGEGGPLLDSERECANAILAGGRAYTHMYFSSDRIASTLMSQGVPVVARRDTRGEYFTICGDEEGRYHLGDWEQWREAGRLQAEDVDRLSPPRTPAELSDMLTSRYPEVRAWALSASPEVSAAA